MDTLYNIVMNANQDIIPANTCPIRDKSCREKSSGVCGILCALPGIKAPGRNIFMKLY